MIYFRIKYVALLISPISFSASHAGANGRRQHEAEDPLPRRVVLLLSGRQDVPRESRTQGRHLRQEGPQLHLSLPGHGQPHEGRDLRLVPRRPPVQGPHPQAHLAERWGMIEDVVDENGIFFFLLFCGNERDLGSKDVLKYLSEACRFT